MYICWYGSKPSESHNPIYLNAYLFVYVILKNIFKGKRQKWLSLGDRMEEILLPALYFFFKIYDILIMS